MRLHHVALRVADCERAAAFYAGILGLRELRRLDDEAGALRSIWLQADGVVLMVERSLRSPGPGDGSGHVLAFAADDLVDWAERLTRAGITIDDRTEYTLYVRDPDGHRVALSTYEL